MTADSNKKSYSNWIIGGLVLVIIGLIYFNRITSNKLALKDNALITAQDTAHLFKTKLGNQGAYIATITADKNSLINILELKEKESGKYKDIIDSLKKDNSIQSISKVETETKTRYIKDIDTIYKALDFRDSIQTKWYDAGVHIKNSKLGLNLTQRDELNLTSKLKDNKGLFTGKTLTTFATSNNPNTNITGITSISTVVDKRKIRLGVTVGPSALITPSGNIAVGAGATIGISF